MTFLRTLRSLVLGETWALPIGVAVLVGAAALLREAAPHAWHDAGGPALIVGVLGLLVFVVARSATRR